MNATWHEKGRDNARPLCGEFVRDVWPISPRLLRDYHSARHDISTLDANAGRFITISVAILNAIYGLVLLAMLSVLWVVRFVFWINVCAAVGVTLLVVHPVWWMVRAVARLGKDAHDIQSSHAGNTAAVSHGTAGQRSNSVPAPLIRRSSFPDAAISARQAREVLFAYEQRVFCARSEVREIAARTRETIAQTQALMAQADARVARTRAHG